MAAEDRKKLDIVNALWRLLIPPGFVFEWPAKLAVWPIFEQALLVIRIRSQDRHIF
jgi:hypothetical protein